MKYAVAAYLWIKEHKQLRYGLDRRPVRGVSNRLHHLGAKGWGCYQRCKLVASDELRSSGIDAL